jgi:prepilin-type N-terminal cleavage/methylation domain-containing protein
MECAHKEIQSGFTLVEIAIVMIIIGLLIGGTFGGMKLIENMQVNKTVQDLKAIESAALTFKDNYGRLPGDLVNPAARLPSCTVAPCSTAGNGDRRISPVNTTTLWSAPQDITYERFTFWSHLQAANLLALSSKNTTDMSFGEGQPEAGVDGGYRITEYTGLGGCNYTTFSSGIILVLTDPVVAVNDPAVDRVPCAQVRSIDNKMDDGQATLGRIVGNGGCASNVTCAATYVIGNTGHIFYDAKF